ncbi:MAG: hypothetical protein QOI42_2127 [Frankiaceae bacterium]|nr:hypothetical protein [Frankiaceae bacterium]
MPDSASSDLSAIDAAMRKAAVVWLGVASLPAYAVWPLWHERTLVVLSGGDEQPAPGLAEATSARVLVPTKGARELALSFDAAVRTVAPLSDEWNALTALLVPRRLNMGDVATAPGRWAATCTVSALTPVTATAA